MDYPYEDDPAQRKPEPVFGPAAVRARDAAAEHEQRVASHAAAAVEAFAAEWLWMDDEARKIRDEWLRS